MIEFPCCAVVEGATRAREGATAGLALGEAPGDVIIGVAVSSNIIRHEASRPAERSTVTSVVDCLQHSFHFYPYILSSQPRDLYNLLVALRSPRASEVPRLLLLKPDSGDGSPLLKSHPHPPAWTHQHRLLSRLLSALHPTHDPRLLPSRLRRALSPWETSHKMILQD